MLFSSYARPRMRMYSGRTHMYILTCVYTLKCFEKCANANISWRNPGELELIVASTCIRQHALAIIWNARTRRILVRNRVMLTIWISRLQSLNAVLFFIRIHVPSPYDPGFRFFVKQSSKQEEKNQQKHSKFVFSCKNGLKQWWTEHLYCTRSPLLTYTITECLLARSGFARSGPIYCHLYATSLLMPTAYRHTSWYPNLFILVI